ncbi:MAG TPA: DUF5305 family protein, partial [Acidimicrobiales bacterium]|nr:DUF5305 family protein [Acidimicrobiales bacterium]
TARYRLHPGATGAGAADLSGTIGASVDLLGPEGWTGHVTSTGPVAFTGTTAAITVGIDFARVTAVEHAFAQETGVPLGPGNVVVTPTVRVRGSVGGAPVRTSYAPALTFQLSSSEFSLASASPTAGGGGEQLDPSASGSGDRLVEVPATLPVLGIPLRVGAARTLALLGMLLSLVAGLAVLGWLERRRRMDEPTRIRASHGHSLVSVSSSPALDAPLVVDVETFGGLVRLAERFDCVILDLGHGAGHTYYVECGATVYRYGLEPGDEALPGPSDDPGPPGDLTYHVKALRSVS